MASRSSSATEAPARHATLAYGVGVAFDVGFDYDCARLANNAINYKTAPQQPTAYASGEVRNFTGAGTRQVVEMHPICIGMGGYGWRARYLYVAPRFRSTTGATATCRVTLCRLRPTGATRDDVTFLDPYGSRTFTTTSTNYTIPAASTIDTSLPRLAIGSNGGWGWIIVELQTVTEYTGLARCYLGPLVAV